MANVVVVVFLILSIAAWSHYGLFSAFLHLMVTITCAALALALWEPLVLGVLIDRMPYYAWCVGLLGPFVLLLVVVRSMQDKLVRWNLRFENLSNVIGGGFCGLLSSILISGLVIIAVGLMPMGESIMGYQPVTVNHDGTLEGRAGDGLLFPVDRWTAGFFDALSLGAFYPTGGTPLARHQPRLADRAVFNRLHPVDPGSSPAVHPDSVRIDHVAQFGSADLGPLMGDAASANESLLLVGTVWNADKFTYDRDGRLRLPPSQVRLVTSPQFATDESVALHRPEGVVIESGQSLRFKISVHFATTLARGEITARLKEVFATYGASLSDQAVVTVDDDVWRIADRGEAYELKHEGDGVNVYGAGANATRFDTDGALAYTQIKSNVKIVWVFLMPVDQVARGILLRTLRVELPEPLGDMPQRHRYGRFARALYAKDEPESARQPTAAAGPAGPAIEGPNVGPTQHGGGYGDDVQATSALPYPLSVTQARHQHRLQNNKIFEGDAVAEASRHRSLSPNTRVDEIYTASDEYMVRVRVGRENALSLFGKAKQAAARVGPFFIEDTSGASHHAVGYVWVKTEDNVQHIKVDRIGSLQRISQLPLRDMRRDDDLFLYFAIPRNVGVRRLVVGQADQKITGVGPPPVTSR